MFDQLPKMFGGRAAVRNDDNVTPLRDTEPTRPHRFQHNPQPTPQQQFPSGTYGPRLPKAVSLELVIAREIFTELLSVEPEARKRIVDQVDHLLKMYGTEGEMPTVEGAPV